MKTVKITNRNVEQLLLIACSIDYDNTGSWTSEWNQKSIEVGSYFRYDDSKNKQWMTFSKADYEFAKKALKAEREAKKFGRA